MTREEFEEALRRLCNDVCMGMQSQRLRRELWRAYEKRLPTPSFVFGFFYPVIEALRATELLSLGRAFDRDRRTNGLYSLFEAMQKETTLVPRLDGDRMDKLQSEFENLSHVYERRIKPTRDKELAHLDMDRGGVGGRRPVLTLGTRHVYDGLIAILNDLQVAYDGSEPKWSWPVSLEETRKIVDFLMQYPPRTTK